MGGVKEGFKRRTRILHDSEVGLYTFMSVLAIVSIFLLKKGEKNPGYLNGYALPLAAIGLLICAVLYIHNSLTRVDIGSS